MMNPPTRIHQRLWTLLATAVLALGLAACASGPKEAPWPEQIVSIDDMHSTTPWHAQIPPPEKDKVRDRSRPSTVVLLAHVNEEGQVLKIQVQQTSGTPVLDEAAISSMRQLRFLPYRAAGTVQAVTVLAPMRFPFYDRER